MRPESLFISDLHLSAARPDITGRFLAFVENRARGAERLYILGDLFDAYIGDDDDSSPNREVKAALRRLSDCGTAVFFQHGNRDFLVGERFCRQTGATLLGDYAVIDLGGQAVLLTHGDLLCTDDMRYQAARSRVRTAEWKRHALSRPLLIRQLYARWYRLKSGWDKRKNTPEIMDANPDAVIAAMRRYGVNQLIHGHTHRPKIHHLEIDGQPARRFVLSEWNPTGAALCWKDEEDWSIEAMD
jgi:UDP-2,3-diacylglucosamine hydrolase